MSKIPVNIIIANYSVHSLALICWAKKNLKDDFCVLSVDTGFSSYDWAEYLTRVFAWLDTEVIEYCHRLDRLKFYCQSTTNRPRSGSRLCLPAIR